MTTSNESNAASPAGDIDKPKDDRLTLCAFAGTMFVVMAAWLALLALGAWWLFRNLF